MFECYIVLYLPLQVKGTSGPSWLVIAKYDFDPGLQENDLISVQNISLNGEASTQEFRAVINGLPKFNLDAIVARRRKYVIAHPGHGSNDDDTKPGKDVFRLFIDIEAEQGKRAEIVSILKQEAPMVFEDFVLPWSIPASDES